MNLPSSKILDGKAERPSLIPATNYGHQNIRNNSFQRGTIRNFHNHNTFSDISYDKSILDFQLQGIISVIELRTN